MSIIIKIVILLGFLIIIHELGHFIVARLCKVKVNEFSIGFGKIIYSKKIKETTYEIRLIPLGGFVNLEGENNESKCMNSFSKASNTKKILILCAGALVNILFGILLYFIIISINYSIVKNAQFYESIQYGFNSLGHLFNSLFEGIRDLIFGKLTLNDMTGPIGISAMISKTNGINEFLFLLSIISISLGITNLLPIIPLDGGKILLVIIEKIRKKPIRKETMEKLQTIGFALLLFLSVMVTCNDIKNILQ